MAILSRFQAKVLTDITTKAEPLVDTGKKKLSIQSLCTATQSALYNVDLISGYRGPITWTLPPEYKLTEGWKKPSASCPEDYNITREGKSVPLKSFSLIKLNSKNLERIPLGHLQEAGDSDLSRVLKAAVGGVMRENLPEVVYWEFSEKDLLPSSVDIATFAADPDTQIPLKNMFVLAGIAEDKIQSSLQEKQKGTPNHIQNYLDNIAEKTTAHFREVWKDYEEIFFRATSGRKSHCSRHPRIQPSRFCGSQRRLQKIRNISIDDFRAS